MSCTVRTASAVSLLVLSLPATSAEPATAAAQSVVITATRFPDRAETLPFGVSVVTAAEIERAGVRSVNEALMKLLGVPGRADSYGGGNHSLDLRAFGDAAGSNQVVVLDGVRLNEGDMSSPRLASIPIDRIERIEVMRGSGAVLYGEGATGGVIVITTKGGRLEAPQGRAYLAAGSNRLREASADLGVPLGAAVVLDASAGRRESDNHRDNFRSEIDAASVGVRWRPTEDTSLGLRLSHDELDTGLPGPISAGQMAADPRHTDTPDDRAAIRNTLAVLSGTWRVGGWDLALDAGWRDKALRSVSFGFPYAYDVKADTQSLRGRRRFATGAVTQTLTLGVDAGHWERQVLGDGGSRATQRSLGVYAKDDIDLGTRTRVSVGARTERLRRSVDTSDVRLDEREHAWEVGVTQALDDRWAAYARVGRSFRLPNVDEFTYTQPDHPLRPQTSRDAEAGLRFAQDGHRAELRAYRSALRHEIGYDPAAPGRFPAFPGANVNFDATRRQGLEFEGRLAVSRDWGLRLNAARRQARFTEGTHAGRDVPLTARTTAALNVDWQATATQRVDAGVRHVGSQHPDFANACSLPSYTTVDARYSVQFGPVELALKVDNLTDRRYATQAYACAGGTATSLYPEPGRTATASLRWTFL